MSENEREKDEVPPSVMQLDDGPPFEFGFGYQKSELRAAQFRAAQAEQDRAEMLDLLRVFNKWIEDGDNYVSCPRCQTSGAHVPGCEFAALLARLPR